MTTETIPTETDIEADHRLPVSNPTRALTSVLEDLAELREERAALSDIGDDGIAILEDLISFYERRLPRLLGALPVEIRSALVSQQPADLKSREAAALLGLARPDGSPQDSFYALKNQLGAYKAGRRWLWPVASIEAYKENGGSK